MVTKDSETGEELLRVTLVKGYEYAKNRYLVLSDEDFDAVKVESSAIMSVEKFVDAESMITHYASRPTFQANQNETVTISLSEVPRLHFDLVDMEIGDIGCLVPEGSCGSGPGCHLIDWHLRASLIGTARCVMLRRPIDREGSAGASFTGLVLHQESVLSSDR
jgi:hypothetical protein